MSFYRIWNRAGVAVKTRLIKKISSLNRHLPEFGIALVPIFEVEEESPM